ncbi:MAG TPA: hypothetical protein VEG64_17340 [Candidatus Sulfotelmatobacter sp.]|nr:hypothetical protein [Candidatus Sulfotelmatobacter sp.]
MNFDDWVKAVFAHPTSEPEWYWDKGFDEYWDALGLSDALTVEYMTRLFLDPSQLKPYSLGQVAQAIWFLIAESSPGQCAHTLLMSGVPLKQRIGCVDAMVDFFRVFVAPAAPDEADEQKNPFHTACYMWWDIFPSCGGPNAGEPRLHLACLNTMAAVLTMPSELCRLSALHGLNHWHLHYADKVEAFVDEFLRKTPGLTPRIVGCADTARLGRAL